MHIAVDTKVQLPKGYAYVHFKARKDAQEAIAYMDGVSVVGPRFVAMSDLLTCSTSAKP